MNPVMLVVMALQMFFATASAKGDSLAETILFCFAAYLCLQFVKKDGGDNG